MGNTLQQVFYIFVLILFTCIAHMQCGFFRMGAKTEGTMRYLRPCETDKDTRQIFSIYHYKYNHTHFAANANWTVLEPFDTSYKLRIDMRKWSDGGWKRNFFNIDRNDACDSLHLLMGSLWTEMQVALGMKPRCPVEPGVYKMEAFIDSTFQKAGYVDSPLAANSGKFYYLLHIIKHTKISICVEFETEVYEIFN